jgi:hypothetical protein
VSKARTGFVGVGGMGQRAHLRMAVQYVGLLKQARTGR